MEVKQKLDDNNSELDSLRKEAKEKDQKIIELEQEIKALKDKSPV
ncbi:23864_t:CDS:2, partial [Gigaspora rosea]